MTLLTWGTYVDVLNGEPVAVDHGRGGSSAVHGVRGAVGGTASSTAPATARKLRPPLIHQSDESFWLERTT